ncbi:M20 metallopeptidase family protein [Maricaulis sp.]|uniref:M20 metallopeptidase family protein n=1 Tax=Maricaulis sp. TaxID=1486257 RepID=UPI003A933A95
MKRQFLSAVAALALMGCTQPSSETANDAATPSDAAAVDTVAPVVVAPGDDALRASIAADYTANLQSLYEHFHANPELSLMEVETAARLASELRALGYEVTEGVGGTGLVAVLVNGEGPTVMMRADMDGLPLEEQTDVPYASTVTGIDRRGLESHVMHACAHDTHMTALVGTARQMMDRRDDWSGTLVLVGQPAEEIGLGAGMMIEDGLFERFPQPDFNLSFHTFSGIPSGHITYAPGYAMANVDSVDITVHGRGGHGAYPQATKDPVYLSAQIIVALQSLISRELSPLDPGVITVGAIHGGTKHNIISDEVHLQLTVRSYTDEVRDHLLTGIERIAHAQAASYGLTPDEYPDVEVEEPYTPAMYNDPALTARAVSAMRARFGSDSVTEADPVMGGEDFAQYHRTEAAIPSFMFWVGGTTREQLAAYAQQGIAAPSNHSPLFAPDDPQTSITMAIEASTAVAMDLLPKPTEG